MFLPGDGRLCRDHFDGQHFLDLMIAGDHRVHFVQRGGMIISLTALVAHVRRHIFDDVKPPVEPLLLSDLPLGSRLPRSANVIVTGLSYCHSMVSPELGVTARLMLTSSSERLQSASVRSENPYIEGLVAG